MAELIFRHNAGNTPFSCSRVTVCCFIWLLCAQSCDMTCVSSSSKIDTSSVQGADSNTKGDARSATDSECYRGDCVDEICECENGWGGEYCDRCSGRVMLTDETGFVSDGPKNYPEEMECSWLIQPDSRNVLIRLTFLEFASECGWDYLYIYDGDSAYSPLLATFNGLLRTAGSSSDSLLPEVVATSGSVFMYFFSDVAYTMHGFNISYAVQSCPQNCFGRGTCKAAGNTVNCVCDPGWTGEACEHLSCPSNCSGSLNQGECVNGSSGADQTCQCKPGFQGPDCSASVPPQEGFWSEKESVYSVLNTAKASHASLVMNGSMWVFGGIQFGDLSQGNSLFQYSLATGAWTIVKAESSVMPTPRYGHSLIAYQSKLVLFGGREYWTEKILDELWEFDTPTQKWTQIQYIFKTVDNSTTSPLSLWGHSGTFAEFKNNSKIMVVMFGYHPTLEYSGFVYEYDLTSHVWSAVVTGGAFIEASYGHSAVWDPHNRLIYVHGGIVYQKANNYGLTDTAYSYDPEMRLFTILRSSGVPRYLHSGVLSEGTLFIYGGCTHNDSSESTGALCFSPGFMAYSVACDRWEHLESLDQTYLPSRYGHSAVIVEKSSEDNTPQMLVYGGYDGTLRKDTLSYTIASCSIYKTNETQCIGSKHVGISCTWNGTCLPALMNNETDSCVPDSAGPYCSDISGCSSCLNAAADCVMCDDLCSASKCKKVSPLTNTSKCDDEYENYCGRFRTCSQCQLNEKCRWSSGRCVVDESNSQTAKCPMTCGSITSCGECTDNNACMWCTNKNLCVSTISYVVQFPYGECIKWINKNEQCPVAEACTSQRTCSTCQTNPFCGWCDDGSETGLGTCQNGAASGSNTNYSLNVLAGNGPAMYNSSIPACPAKSWYFATCPICQCNGHSRCVANSSECQTCENMTTGDQCETCVDGYFGDARNGGTCGPCQCADRATLCNNTSGVCFCSTKGETGDKCERCDNTAKYYGDPKNNGTCFYRLLINYSFTFTLTANHDKYVTAINFENTPPLSSNAQLNFEAQQPCNVRLAVYHQTAVVNSERRVKRANNETDEDEIKYTGYELDVKEYFNTEKFSFDFSGGKYSFGDSSINSTIRIYVQNLTIPTWIQVSLVQRSNSLLILLLILFSCFLVILLLTALAWKLKMLYDACQNRRQRAEQLEAMAARPFSTVHLDFDGLYDPEWTLPTIPAKVHAISEEQSADGNVSAVTVIFWMPSGRPVMSNEDQNLLISDLQSENSSLAFGTALLSSSTKLSTAQPEVSQVESASRSRAKKLKVVFKRGSRRSMQDSRPSSRQGASQHSNSRCGAQQNQSNNNTQNMTHGTQPENVPARATSDGANTNRRRSSKRGRASFTSIRSSSVSPSSAAPIRDEGTATQGRTQPRPCTAVLAYENQKRDEVTV